MVAITAIHYPGTDAKFLPARRLSEIPSWAIPASAFQPVNHAYFTNASRWGDAAAKSWAWINPNVHFDDSRGFFAFKTVNESYSRYFSLDV